MSSVSTFKKLWNRRKKQVALNNRGEYRKNNIEEKGEWEKNGYINYYYVLMYLFSFSCELNFNVMHIIQWITRLNQKNNKTNWAIWVLGC